MILLSTPLFSHWSIPLIVSKARKERGREICQSNRHDFLYNRQCFLGQFKGSLLSKS
jgi:hypothetical protein